MNLDTKIVQKLAERFSDRVAFSLGFRTVTLSKMHHEISWSWKFVKLNYRGYEVYYNRDGAGFLFLRQCLSESELIETLIYAMVEDK